MDHVYEDLVSRATGGKLPSSFHLPVIYISALLLLAGWQEGHLPVKTYAAKPIGMAAVGTCIPHKMGMKSFWPVP